jgi:hypothetical protein
MVFRRRKHGRKNNYICMATIHREDVIRRTGRLGLCFLENLGPRGSEGKVLKIKRN